MYFRDQTSMARERSHARSWIHIMVPIMCVLVVMTLAHPFASQTNANVSFGQAWGKIKLPVRARVAVIDQSDRLEIGLSAMQLDNIGWVGEYNAVQIQFGNNYAKAYVYNASGIGSLSGDNVRISSALSEDLGCTTNEFIVIKALAIIEDRQPESVSSRISGFIRENWKWLWTSVFIPVIGWWIYYRRRRTKDSP